MQRKWISNWFLQGLLTNAAWQILPIIVFSAITFFWEQKSKWAVPISRGLFGALLAAIFVAIIRLGGRLPKKLAVPSPENVETLARDWLDSFKVGLKKDPFDGAYFRFRVTMDSGVTMSVMRGKDLPSYLGIAADITPVGNQIKFLESLADDARNNLLDALRLELARARVGFHNLTYPITSPVTIFTRIPINEHLTESALFDKVVEIEASIGAVRAVYSIATRKPAKINHSTQEHKPIS